MLPDHSLRERAIVQGSYIHIFKLKARSCNHTRRAENRGQATVDELVEVNLSIDQESRLTYSSPSPPCEACVISCLN